MSDYIAGLRADLVDAAARHQRRGSLARRALPVLPRAWSRPALAAAAAVAACVAAIVVAVSTIGPPAPAPAKPQRLAVVRLGIEPFDATYAAGGLWAMGANGQAVRVERGRVTQRVTVGDLQAGIAGAGDSVWTAAITTGDRSHGDATLKSGLVQLDATTGAVKRRRPRLLTEIGPMAVGAGALWVVPDTTQNGDRIERLDPVTGRRVALVRGPFRNDLAAGGDTLWAIGQTGDLAEIDTRSNRVAAVIQGANEASGLNGGPTRMSLAVDGDGVWVAGGTRGDVLLVRAGQIARRIPVGAGSVDGVARTRGALWVVLTVGATSQSYRLVRLDPDTGRQTGTLDLGHLQPTALVPAGSGLWVATLDGSATLIR